MQKRQVDQIRPVDERLIMEKDMNCPLSPSRCMEHVAEDRPEPVPQPLGDMIISQSEAQGTKG